MLIIVNNWGNESEFIWFDISAVFFPKDKAMTFTVGAFGIQLRLTLQI